MHIYWNFYMLKVGMGIFKSGKYKNVYDNKENGLDNDTKGKAN
jgi:ceramide synthetase